MAKTSSVEKNKRREQLSKLHYSKRAALKATVMNRELPMEDRFEATLKLAQLPRNGAKNRVRLRCELTGRPRGNYALGLKEQIVFPEIIYDKVDTVRGMDIVFVTTAKTDKEAKALLKAFQLPFQN